MATKSSKPNKKPVQGDLMVQLIGAIADALAKPITTSASATAILGILVSLDTVPELTFF